MKAKEALIAWTPKFFEDNKTVGQVKVGPLIKNRAVDWVKAEGYKSTGGAALSFPDSEDGLFRHTITVVYTDH